MRPAHLANVDLNLLPALSALLSERSVSRAAASIGLSQSAMSRALTRLRRVLGDELLVRTGDGYQLTPAADRLRVQMGDVMPHLQEMFLPGEYDPATETGEYRMSCSDYALATFGSRVFAAVLSTAPLSSVRFLPWHSKVVQDLVDGRVDLLFSGWRLEKPINSQPLFTDEMVCVVDRQHPLSQQKSLTMEEYLACKHLVIDIIDGTQPSIDAVLSGRGRLRQASLTLPYHAIAPEAVIGTDLVLSIPERVRTKFVDAHSPRLCVLAAPADITPLPYFMSWHSRLDRDKGHTWLRGVAATAITQSL